MFKFRSILITLFAATSLAFAQDIPENAKTQALGPLAYKVDARLIPSIKALHTGAATDKTAASEIKRAHGRALADSPTPELLSIRIDAVITDALLAQVRGTGALVTHSAPQWNTISASATLSQIEALSQIAGVRTVTLQAALRRHQQGNTPNAADDTMKSAQVRALSGLSGKNQTVGVISDSIIDTAEIRGGSTFVTGTQPNAFLSGTVPQNSGDLPTSIQIVDAGPGQGSDEGAAMLELIHDIAPAASLAFASIGTSQTSQASNLLALRSSANCSVTCDDIAFLDEPAFQDGPVAQAISINAKAGVPHFSAFGNAGSDGILQPYLPSNPSVTSDESVDPPTVNTLHNWGISTPTPSFLPIQLSSGDALTVVLEWNQPFSSYNLGAGSQADLDLLLYSSNAIGKPLALAAAPQGIAGAPMGDPIEILFYVNDGPATTVYLALNHYAGVRNNMMWLVFSDSKHSMSFPAGGVSGPTGIGHPSGKDCIGVGAVNNQDIVLGNLKPEPFSSQGGLGTNGIPFYFDGSGNPLPNAPFLRSAPDIAAPDGVDTTTFHQFLGTSCSAPNAAGVAALLLEGAPGISKDDLLAAIQSSARDVDLGPSTPGPDAFSGAGLIDAQAAFLALVKPPTITSPTSATGNVASFFSYAITATGPGTISFSASSLPPGITSNGNIISGLPTAAGKFTTTTVSASNAGGMTTQSLTIDIGPQVPVRILSQPGATPNPAEPGVAVSFSVSAQSDNSLPLTFTWDFGDNKIGTGSAPTHAYAAKGDYIAVVTVSDGSVSVSSTVTVQVKVKPQLAFISGPDANPHAPGVGETVFFFASASEGNVPLTYTWNFGDGNTTTGATPTHVYTAAGTFTATLTVTDGLGGSISGTVAVTVKAPVMGIGDDSDGDGYSDNFELTIGTDPLDPRFTPLSSTHAPEPQPLNLAKPTISLNFTKQGNDSITFSGTIPIHAGFSPNQQAVGVDVSGVDFAFLLDAKGSGRPFDNGFPPPAKQKGPVTSSFKVQFKSKKGVVEDQTGRFTVKLGKGDFANTLAAVGLTSTVSTPTPVKLVFSLLFDIDIFQAHPTLTYSAKGGKTGKAH